MKKSILLLAVLVLTIIQAKAQCPTALFSLPDSACSGSSVQILNSSIGNNLIYNWDFNSADFDSLPTGSTVLSSVTGVSQSLGVDFENDNGNYFGFSVNTGGTLTRFDFGNSIENTPTVVAMGNLGVMASNVDIRIIKENGLWYALSNTFGNQVYRLDFGSSLANTPTVTTLNISSSLFNLPYYMCVKKIGISYYAILCNYSGNNITVIDFGTSITNNTPNAFNIATPNSNPISATLTNDCGNIYAMIGFAAGYALVQIDFGSTITATPNSITSLNVNSATAFRKLEMTNDGKDFILLAHSLGGESMQQFNFGQHLNNLSPTIKYLGNFNTLSSGYYTFSAHKFGSTFYGLSTNYDNGNVIRFKYNEVNSGSAYTSQLSNPAVTFDHPGNYRISLITTDTITGLSNNIWDSIYINELPNPGFITNGACEGSIVELIDTTSLQMGSITNHDWLINSGSSLSGDTINYIFPSGGNYNVTLDVTSSSGCNNSFSSTINIAPLPTAAFSFSDNECEEKEITFNNQSLANQGFISNYNWNFGDSNTSTDSVPLHAYNSFGTFNVELVVTANGCVDTLTQSISIIEKPKAKFNALNTCIGETVSFINSSTFSGPGVSSSNWDFGDSNTSSTNSPTHQYSNTAGTYTVQLVETASNGCIDSIQKEIKIGHAPTAVFTISKDTACAMNSIQFTDNSTPFTGDTIIARYWDFGDGDIDSTQINPTHAYSLPGTYTIKLTVVSPTYCDSSYEKSIFVIESPQAQFSTTNVCLHNQSTFNDLSTPVIGSSITGWNWNFGDGDSSSTQNNSHLYQNAGNYTVLLTITSKEGCYDTISSVVSVYNLPSVNFTNSKACTNSPIQFNDSTTCTSGFPSNWLWDFGTGIQSTLQNPAYTYANAFAYPIKLVVSSNYGCLDSLTKFIIINQSPQFNINANDNCFNTTTNFQSIPVQGSSTNVGYIWNLGDSSYSTNPNPQHIYNAPGSYNINLTVTNLGNSCSTNISDTVKINPLPKAKFLSDSACVNTNLQLTDLSTINGGIINNYKWTIGSYGTSNLQNPIINLAAADSFAVKLLVTSNTGCKDSTTEVIEINPLPTVSFTPNPYFGAPPLDVTFSTTSNNNTNMWDFGDGSNTIIGNGIQHTFNDTGSYTVHLISTTSKGCTDSSDKVITVLIPYTDLSIETINFTKVSDYWQLSARIKNNGNQIISNYILKSRLSEKSPITEVFENDTLNTGQTKNITFKSRFTVDNNDNPGYLCMEVMEVNHGHDENETNNKKCITSTNEFEVFNTYPNPFESDINVDVNIPTKGTVSVKLYNLLGGYLSEPIERNVLKGYNSFTINGSYLQKGIYFLEIRYKDQKSIVKILKY